MLDTQGNGFLTLDDLRDASSECNLHFSNNTLREMIQDADKHGEGKISLADFTDMMLQTSRFKYASWRNAGQEVATVHCHVYRDAWMHRPQGLVTIFVFFNIDHSFTKEVVKIIENK